MDNTFHEAAREDCALVDEWDPEDYRWDPYLMKATKIDRHGNAPIPKRRGRARSRGTLSCQVEGCPSSLTSLKEYHQRYKICPIHMKAESILRDGVPNRFCQQCGRFHVLQDFDGAKRSCRIRLARHNQRRRKKTDEPLKRLGSDRSSPLSQSNSPTDSNIAVEMEEVLTEIGPDPSAVVHPIFAAQEQNPYYSNNSQYHLQHTQELRGVDVLVAGFVQQGLYRKEQASFLADPLCNSCSDLPSKPDYDAVNMIPGSLAGGYRSFVGQDEPDDFLRGMAENPAGKYTVPSEGALPGSCAGVSLSMPLISNVFSGNPLMDPVAFVPSKQNQKSMGYGDCCHRSPSCFTLPCNLCPTQTTRAMRNGDAETLALDGIFREERQLDYDQAARYKSLLRLTSLSVKVFDCVPNDLPKALRNELLQAVQGGLVPEGYMRPGCVHLIFDVFQPGYRKATTPDDIVSKLLSSQCSFWKERDMMVEMDGTSILLSSGKPKERLGLGCNAAQRPDVTSVHPVCVLSSASKRQFTVCGKDVAALRNSSIHCRIHGKFIPVTVDDFSGARPECLSFAIEEDLPCGALKIEVSEKRTIEQSLPVVVVDDSNVVTEIESFHGQYGCELSDFLVELGLAVELRSWLQAVCLHYCVDSADLGMLFRSSVSSFRGRFGFRNASKTELNCCILSACQLYTYCKTQGLNHTAEYLHSVVILRMDERIVRVPNLLPTESCVKHQAKRKQHLKFMRLTFQRPQADKAITCF